MNKESMGKWHTKNNIKERKEKKNCNDEYCNSTLFINKKTINMRAH